MNIYSPLGNLHEYSLEFLELPAIAAPLFGRGNFFSKTFSNSELLPHLLDAEHEPLRPRKFLAFQPQHWPETPLDTSMILFDGIVDVVPRLCVGGVLALHVRARPKIGSYLGEKPMGQLGHQLTYGGDVNSDGYEDILSSAQRTPRSHQ